MSALAVSVARVKQVVKVRVAPSEAQAAALQASLGTCNRAASWFATLHAWAFAQLGAFFGYKAQAAGGVRSGRPVLQQSNLPWVRVGRQT